MPRIPSCLRLLRRFHAQLPMVDVQLPLLIAAFFGVGDKENSAGRVDPQKRRKTKGGIRPKWIPVSAKMVWKHPHFTRGPASQKKQVNSSQSTLSDRKTHCLMYFFLSIWPIHQNQGLQIRVKGTIVYPAVRVCACVFPSVLKGQLCNAGRPWSLKP